MAGLGRVKMWVSEVFNHGYHSLLTPSSLSFFFRFLFSFGTLFSTLIVVPPYDVTVLYNLCCVSAKSFSVLLGFFLFLYFFLSLLSATASELHEVEEKGNCQVLFVWFF